MNDRKKPTDDLIWFLQEREKELNCLYRIDEVLSKPEADIAEVCRGIIEVIPPGWQYPNVCQARIILDGTTYQSPDFAETPWLQSSEIAVQDKIIGQISVYYTKEMPAAHDGPFLKEEIKLLKTIADRISHFIFQKRMKQVYQEYQTARQELSEHKAVEWRVVLNLLRRTDKNLYQNISQKMLNHLCWSGIEDAEILMRDTSSNQKSRFDVLVDDDNQPLQKNVPALSDKLSDEIFKIAARNLSNEQILASIQKWMQEDKTSFLAHVVNRNLSLAEVADSIRRYRHIAPEGMPLTPANKRGIEVSLIRRFLSSQPHFINIAKQFIEINDFYDFIDHLIFTSESHGKLGGKSAGLFLANKIIKKSDQYSESLKNIKVPRTWYITSDVLLGFLSYNNLGEVVEQKYKDVNQVRLEYPHIVQILKSCRFQPEITQSLSMVLDDFSDKPLIVRSSSLLEDRFGAAFSGKYKSLFLANQGTKQQRLEALMDAIAEVYASTFGPDPIEYRSQKGLIDFSEEMGIMIQEVVGTRIGDYYMPLFAGVAFSRNEFRWSPRIKRDDGLLRIVPGLGTRAVDRISDDYPVLIAPGQPDLQVNVTADEIVRYAPKKMDVINLQTNAFETIDISHLIREYGHEMPDIKKIISIFDGSDIHKPVNLEFDADIPIATFEGLINDTAFVRQINSMLKLLESKMKTPVDIEFASDGKNLYLLQCRPQSYMGDSAPSPIPGDIPAERIIFSANRYISNGRVPDITHIVYVEPQSYYELSDRANLLAVGRAVSKLNKLLPRHQFILMGPGRWGSRGNIKLGVSVTYSDINNTSVLIEIARKKGNYLPDLSFGTHFFQDLVESDIRYIPLYPDDDETIFNEDFFEQSDNIFPVMLPEFKHLADTIKLIDVPKTTGGLVLRILMNAERDEAVGILAEPLSEVREEKIAPAIADQQTDNHWAWRLRMAEYIASQLDPDNFGVKGIYIFGSTKNANAGPKSDIDLLIHFRGSDKQRDLLLTWLNGWSLCLDEMNYLRTGFRTGGLLDIHIITDEDIANKTSYALKIEAVTDAARPLAMMLK
jgi:pyruvate,water dikinase